jgi:hypothetical protein
VRGVLSPTVIEMRRGSAHREPVGRAKPLRNKAEKQIERQLVPVLAGAFRGASSG